jgi:hypothetical protein
VKLTLTINAGDKVAARTAVHGDQVSFHIIDKTTGKSWAKTLTMTAAKPDTSTAEWVAEAPSECMGGDTSDCSPLPLADFGTAKFTDAHATASGKVGTISDSKWDATAIELEPSASSVFGSGPGGYIGGGYGGYGGYGGGGYAEYSSYSSDSEGAAPTKLSDKGTTFSVKYGASLSTGTQSSGTGVGQGEGSSTYGYGGSSAYGNSYGDGYGYGDSYGYGYGYGGSYGYGYYWGGFGYGY